MFYNPNMSDVEFDEFVKDYPLSALKYAKNRLNPDQLAYCEVTLNEEFFKKEGQ